MTRGPCTPRTRIISISALRDGPVIKTIDAVSSAGNGSIVYSSSNPVNNRDSGNSAICTGGSSDTSRASVADRVTSDPVSAIP